MKNPGRCSSCKGLPWLGLWLLIGLAGISSARAAATPYPLEVKVVHGSHKGDTVDPKLGELAKTLTKKLKFTSLKLLDQAQFKLIPGSAGRMQLPNREWMHVTAKGMQGPNLRVEIAVEKLEFKATVLIPAGATVAVRGPDFNGGTLILAVSRPGPKPGP